MLFRYTCILGHVLSIEHKKVLWEGISVCIHALCRNNIYTPLLFKNNWILFLICLKCIYWYHVQHRLLEVQIVDHVSCIGGNWNSLLILKRIPRSTIDTLSSLQKILWCAFWSNYEWRSCCIWMHIIRPNILMKNKKYIPLAFYQIENSNRRSSSCFFVSNAPSWYLIFICTHHDTIHKDLQIYPLTGADQACLAFLKMQQTFCCSFVQCTVTNWLWTKCVCTEGSKTAYI